MHLWGLCCYLFQNNPKCLQFKSLLLSSEYFKDTEKYIYTQLHASYVLRALQFCTKPLQIISPKLLINDSFLIWSTFRILFFKISYSTISRFQLKSWVILWSDPGSLKHFVLPCLYTNFLTIWMHILKTNYDFSPQAHTVVFLTGTLNLCKNK